MTPDRDQDTTPSDPGPHDPGPPDPGPHDPGPHDPGTGEGDPEGHVAGLGQIRAAIEGVRAAVDRTTTRIRWYAAAGVVGALVLTVAVTGATIPASIGAAAVAAVVLGVALIPSLVVRFVARAIDGWLDTIGELTGLLSRWSRSETRGEPARRVIAAIREFPTGQGRIRQLRAIHRIFRILWDQFEEVRAVAPPTGTALLTNPLLWPVTLLVGPLGVLAVIWGAAVAVVVRVVIELL